MLICWPSASLALRFSLKKEAGGEPGRYSEKGAHGELFSKQRQRPGVDRSLELSATSGFVPETKLKEEVERLSFQEYLSKALKAFGGSKVSEAGWHPDRGRGGAEFRGSKVPEGMSRPELPVPPGSGVWPVASGRPCQNLDVGAIVEAWEAGETLESIAKRLGKGKGEIELILRLWRLKG